MSRTVRCQDCHEYIQVEKLMPHIQAEHQGANVAAVVWFRNDLRMHDNEALAAADREGSSLLAVCGWS